MTNRIVLSNKSFSGLTPPPRYDVKDYARILYGTEDDKSITSPDPIWLIGKYPDNTLHSVFFSGEDRIATTFTDVDDKFTDLESAVGVVTDLASIWSDSKELLFAIAEELYLIQGIREDMSMYEFAEQLYFGEPLVSLGHDYTLPICFSDEINAMLEAKQAFDNDPLTYTFKNNKLLICNPIVSIQNRNSISNLFENTGVIKILPMTCSGKYAQSTFANCLRLTIISNFVAKSVTNADGFCRDDTFLQEAHINMPILNIASNMFQNCTMLTNFPLENMSNFTRLTLTQHMFEKCSKIEFPQFVYNLNMPDCEDCRSMFYMCNLNQELTDCSIPQATNASQMFANTKITKAGKITATVATDLSQMFMNCTSLTEVGRITCTNCKYFGGMFQYCTSLVKIDYMNMKSAVDITNMFQGCSQLQTLNIKNIGYSSLSNYDFSSLTSWGEGSEGLSSLKSTLNMVNPSPSQTPIVIKFSANTKSKISDTMIQNLTKQGYWIQ